MEIATYKNDVWGREVLLGVSWDLLWLVCVVALVIIAGHAVYMATQQRAERPSQEGKHVQRHEPIDRIMHWVMAISILALLFTGVLPIIGIEFAWLTLHWIAGLVLTAAVLFHIIRSVLQKDLMSVWISPSDLKEALDDSHKPGKYSVAQKGMHAAVTVVTLLVIVSGLFMFAMIDTPWWDRTNSLSESTLGWMFLIHGLTTLALIALIAFHLYFTLRPEKLFYLRSMIKGWISEDELSANHDPERWAPDDSA
ncbi:MAG: cytochrome b/b6 domain-containing protein [Gammaproteobacteria bacterium]|nr:MAG: cytochrome b/b6 domain-containing protein [Gammaproteobacteria bacterium]